MEKKLQATCITKMHGEYGIFSRSPTLQAKWENILQAITKMHGEYVLNFLKR